MRGGWECGQNGRVLPRIMRPAVSAMSRTWVFRTVGPRVMPTLERGARVFTRGRTPISGAIVPSLVLHSLGAKTGELRRIELMYCPDGDDILITGSNFARDRHPAWTYNLLAHPDVFVEVKGNRIDVTAVPVPRELREETWVLLERNWPGYRGYERTAGRELRIFRLTPR